MPAAKKAAPRAKKAAPRRATGAAAHTRAKQDARRLDRITKAVETAQKDLAAVGGNVGSSAKELRTNVTKLLRDSSRDLGKMRKALQSDLEKLQKDLASAAKRKPAAAKRKPAAARRKPAARATGRRSTKSR